MTEYIVEVDDQVAEVFVKRFDWKAVTLFGHHLVGEIVRCRDCYFAEEIEGGYWCDRFDCGKEHVTPKSFCAWGERRQDD